MNETFLNNSALLSPLKCLSWHQKRAVDFLALTSKFGMDVLASYDMQAKIHRAGLTI